MLKKEKSCIIIIITILAILGILIIVAFSLTKCTTPSGIPHGIYVRIDENGNYVNGAPTWLIYREKAEYPYMEFKIIEEEGDIFFKTTVKEPTYGDAENEPVVIKYEVKYDKKTRVLTVFMAINGDGGNAPYSFPIEEMEIQELRFKKKGISIG